MEDYSRKDEWCPRLLDLIPKEREWLTKSEERSRHGISEERKLELRLAPPGGEEWTFKENSAISRERERQRLLSLGYFSTTPCAQNNPWQQTHHLHSSPYLHHLQSPQGQTAVTKESSQPCSIRAAAAEQSAAAENKAFSAAAANTAVTTAQKRTAPASVVGWPPIRSFRKNIATSNSSKLASESESQDVAPSKVSTPKSGENCSRSLFVKINMDGIPIGRKVDLKSYNTYEKLSYAVDELFKGLLAAQTNSCGGGMKDEGKGEDEGGKGIGGLLDGSGEYTLVYEDNEGDRMLVGDVPWHMFISTVKRLRVLKSSDLPTICRGCKQGSLAIN